MSETSRQLYIHRNTLVYRLDKLQKSTGLDLRVFEDAITFQDCSDGCKVYEIHGNAGVLMPAFMWLSVIFRRKYQLSTVFSAVDNFFMAL